MNALQKRLAQIGTEPHENGLCDGIVYEDSEDQCYWIYNHYSYCEWLKHNMMHYAGLSREDATEKLAQNSLFTTPPKDLDNLFCITHELTYHNAMEIAKGHRTQRPAILMFFGKNTMLGINKLKKNIA